MEDPSELLYLTSNICEGTADKRSDFKISLKKVEKATCKHVLDICKILMLKWNWTKEKKW